MTENLGKEARTDDKIPQERDHLSPGPMLERRFRRSNTCRAIPTKGYAGLDDDVST